MKEASEKMHHIVLSSGTSEVICRDRHDYTTLENSIALSVIKSGDILPAYCVMSTHCHIALISTSPNDFIKRLKMTYLRYFNTRYRRSKALFEKKTYCEPVTEFLRQRTLINYILRNPLHHGVTETAFRYPHSSIHAYFKYGTDESVSSDGNISGGKQHLKVKDTKGYTYFPLDSAGRIPYKYFVNAGRAEYLYRTERTFIHHMNRWNTEDWEREQKNEYKSDDVITLKTAEPGYESSLDEMRAYERGSWQVRVSDMEICEYIDRTLLPAMAVPSYTHMNAGQLAQAAAGIQQTFHVSEQQILRCLGTDSIR